MHEARLVADLVARAAAAVPDGVSHVDSVRLEVLAGSHVDPAGLVSRFEIWAEGTAVEGARVIVDENGRAGDGDVVLVSVTVRN